MTHTQAQPDLAAERARVLVRFGEAWAGKNLDVLMSIPLRRARAPAIR